MSLGNGNPKEGDKGSNFNYELKVLQGLEAIAVALEPGIVPFTTATTGTNITFVVPQMYNTRTLPATGNITNDLTNARIGIVQKIYHNSLIAPSTPVGWVLVGEGFYVPGVLNIIYAEWVEGTTVEYWITQ
jgi:hypothetical protein